MSFTPFRVNKDLLDYLVQFNYKHKLLLDLHENHKYANIKRNRTQDKEYQAFLSMKILQQNILNIAQTYRNVPKIYFPVKLDNRGRIYTTPSYFNYQGSELAKALISFAKPGIITRNNSEAIEYFKAYGANCFGNGLNRKSYSKKIEWIDSNQEDIINYNNGKLVDLAEEKFLFLAFCLEFKRFNVFLSQDSIHNFKTYLPIQLDATCNGFQHLAMLSNEMLLYEKLNLAGSSKNKDPEDLYKYVMDQLIIYFEKRKNDQAEYGSYKRLSKINWSRSHIKKPLMVKPYNARHPTMVEYVKDTLIFSHTEKVKHLNSNNELSEIEIR
jgi:DNA-directed RNA polymerase